MIVKISILILLSTLAVQFVRADTRGPATDHRARIVESSLKDLSTANDAAIGRDRLEAAPSSDALGAPRVQLQPPEQPQADVMVQREVESSLHRLRRETVNARTSDRRKAAVDDTLSRQAESSRAATDPSP